MSQIKDILLEIHRASPTSKNIKYLISLVDQLRIGHTSGQENPHVEQLINLLTHDETLRNSFQQYLKTTLNRESSIKLLTEVGIMSNEGFFSELSTKLAPLHNPTVGKQA